MCSKTRKDGAKPKLTISDKLSSSLPVSVLDFNNLATIPSRKSKTAASNIKLIPSLICPLDIKTTDKLPENKFSRVIKLGICLTADFKIKTGVCNILYKNKLN